MFLFPIVAIFGGDIRIFLTPFFPSNVLNGNIEHMLALVRSNVATVAVGLFLKIVLRLPNHLMLNNSRKGGNTWKIGRVDKDFQGTSVL